MSTVPAPSEKERALIVRKEGMFESHQRTDIRVEPGDPLFGAREDLERQPQELSLGTAPFSFDLNDFDPIGHGVPL